MNSKKVGKYDAVIIGGGHNGLVCAAYLAKAGRRVLVLEKRHVLGGAAVSEVLYPGFTFSVCSYVVSLFRPQIIRDLELARHGLQIMPLDVSFSPYEDGRTLARWDDPHRTRDEIAKFSRRDADRYPEFGMTMSKVARLAKIMIDSPAPLPTSLALKNLFQLLRLGNHLRSCDSNFLALNSKLLTMSAADFLDEWFESEELKSPMSVSGIIGTFLGIKSPGTAYVLLHHYMGEIDGAYRSWGFAKGGTGQVSLACARAAESFGAEIRTQAPVAEILVKKGKACGVILENGEEILANVVVSNLDPHQTFKRLCPKNSLPEDFVTELDRYKFRGSSGKINLALDRLPEFKGRMGWEHLRGDIAIAPSYRYLETAYDEACQGNFSKRPYMNIVIPSLTDPSVAPPGKHVMSIFIQYAPYHLSTGPSSWPQYREDFSNKVIACLEEFSPGLSNSILYKQVLTPWDLEKDFGLTEGNIFHGELSAEQLLFNRPHRKATRYKTPLKKLWICGSGTHPGGGLMGAPGQLAAAALLNERAV